MNPASEVFILDTHAILWRFRGDARLPVRVHELFDAAERDETTLVVPTIVWAELTLIAERRFPDFSVQDVLDRFDRMASVRHAPLDMAVFEAFRDLPPSLDIHDRVIAATAKVYGCPLVTTDRKLQGAVETIW